MLITKDIGHIDARGVAGFTMTMTITYTTEITGHLATKFTVLDSFEVKREGSKYHKHLTRLRLARLLGEKYPIQLAIEDGEVIMCTDDLAFEVS